MSRSSSRGPRISATVPVAWRRQSSSWKSRSRAAFHPWAKNRSCSVCGVDVADAPPVDQDLDGTLEAGQVQGGGLLGGERSDGEDQRRKDGAAAANRDRSVHAMHFLSSRATPP